MGKLFQNSMLAMRTGFVVLCIAFAHAELMKNDNLQEPCKRKEEAEHEIEVKLGEPQDMSTADWSEFNKPVIPPKIPSDEVIASRVDIDRKCFQHSSCDECLAFTNQRDQTGCGWCASSKKCLPGNRAGPHGSPSVFNCTQWDFGFCTGEPCSVYKSCMSCVQDPFCGWCSEMALCMEGTNVAPLFHFCERWQPHADSPGAQCGELREIFPRSFAKPPKVEGQVLDYIG
eukprot:c33481_g1_i1.p1 GENE.c33481_g1_i1~~c33481_g1_i1.p1  ORF type:complete len:229 (-),score=32.94 c33481_g1_i1:21-707(-)